MVGVPSAHDALLLARLGCRFRGEIPVFWDRIDLEMACRFTAREFCGTSEADNHNERDDQAEQEDTDEVVHGTSAIPQPIDVAREYDDAHANPEREDARHPN